MLKTFAVSLLGLVATCTLAQEPAGMKPVGILGAISGTGAYPAVAESVANLRTATLYHPQHLPRKALPLLLWGNGGCRDNGQRYAQFLREVASQGYFVIAPGYPLGEGRLQPPGSVPLPPEPEGGKTHSSQLLAAIDWATQANRDLNSPFKGHIDVSRVGVMGTSCGGLQAIAVATDPRVKTSIAFNSGVLLALPPGAGPGSDLVIGKDALPKLQGPIAYINGGPTDIAYLNALDDLRLITHVPVFFGENGVGHSGTYFLDEHGGSYARMATAWMNWQLKGDAKAARWFRGADCTLCTRPGWSVQKKQFYGE